MADDVLAPSIRMAVLIDETTLQRRVRELAVALRSEIGAEVGVHYVAVLTGAFVFFADLLRADPGPSTCDFITLSSYRSGATSNGSVTLVRDVTCGIEGRHVVIVEDIVDTGRTLTYLRARLTEQRPASLRAVTLLNKPSRREVDVPIEHVGFDIDDRFVVGYGLDLDGRYRNLPFIGAVTER